ncbi:response regulator transcription factor [Hyphomicrobium sp. 99]|uniref:response regulator transcription factor n=1 Tax=Hyphomicrobium sp. 99 TaxID=1163419 RepID=UPI0005F81BC8|nr:response regulator transcription factor [Hyphomicrobium sp. 99]
MHILLLEDDAETSEFVSSGLRQAAHTVDTIDRGRDGLMQAMNEEYDIIIVDRGLPDLDGLSVTKALRNGGCKVPILFLTSRGTINDRVEGLEHGGDDYVVKPFAFSELLARINVLGRRGPIRSEHETLRCGDLEVNLDYRVVTRAGERIELHPLEFKLLEVLIRNKRRVVLRAMLLERVWGFNFEPKTSVVETHISRLRAKIDKPYRSQLIHTVRGSGYSLYEE